MVQDKGLNVGLNEGLEGLGAELDISGESNSECFTEGTPSHSGSDDENDSLNISGP